jgi:hypothetical protein
MVNFLSEKCYLKSHVGEDKPSQGKPKKKQKTTPSKSHSKGKQVPIGPRKNIRPIEVHYTK